MTHFSIITKGKDYLCKCQKNESKNFIIVDKHFQGKPSVISKQGNNGGGILALFFAPFLFLWNMIRVFLFGDKRSSQPKREDTPDATETPDESQSTRRRDRPQT